MTNTLHTLPAGTDVLAARAAEMKGHPHGGLAREPSHAWQTLATLVTRALALDAYLTTLDGQATPEPDPLRVAAGRVAADPGRELHLSYSLPWEALDALVVRVLAAERRLATIAKATLAEDPADVLAGIGVEIGVDGFGHRHPERFYRALQALVARVLAAEAGAAKWVPATPTTTKTPKASRP